jgi:tetratricopeptide (TPR) repeat protein
MKKQLSLLSIIALFFLGLSDLNAQELPKPSSSAEIHQQVGLTNFTIIYSRPNVKGRDVFGDLVPFSKVWRAGANAATSIEFNSDIELNGSKVKAGKYAIYITPEKENWTIVLNTNWETWGANGYDANNNVLSISAAVNTSSSSTESFTIGFSSVLGDKAALQFSWANVSVNVDVNAPSEEKALANIEEKLKELERTFSSYNSIANFYLDKGDKENGLKYALMSVDSQEEFWNVKTLSVAYAANDDYKMAIETAEKSLELSKTAEYDQYIKINTENIAKWKKLK